MSLNESSVEDAVLEWFGELGYAVGHWPHLAPGEHASGTLIPAFSQREKEEEREAIRRPAVAGPAITEEASACASPACARFHAGKHADRRATGKRNLQVRLERRLIHE